MRTLRHIPATEPILSSHLTTLRKVPLTHTGPRRIRALFTQPSPEYLVTPNLTKDTSIYG